MFLLDTHTWIWWYNDAGRLTEETRRLIRNEIAFGNQIYISSISVWETALLITKKKLSLRCSLTNLIQSTEELGFIQFVPVDNKIFLQSVMLPNYPHKDPADRIILAIAMNLNAALITKDQRLQDYQYVETIW